MSCEQARAEDFAAVREQLEHLDQVLKRHQVRAEGIEFHDVAHALARQRALVAELKEWLEAREDFGDLILSAGAIATAAAFPGSPL
jgi:hypothetical protein